MSQRCDHCGEQREAPHRVSYEDFTSGYCWVECHLCEACAPDGTPRFGGFPSWFGARRAEQVLAYYQIERDGVTPRAKER